MHIVAPENAVRSNSPANDRESRWPHFCRGCNSTGPGCNDHGRFVRIPKKKYTVVFLSQTGGGQSRHLCDEFWVDLNKLGDIYMCVHCTCVIRFRTRDNVDKFLKSRYDQCFSTFWTYPRFVRFNSRSTVTLRLRLINNRVQNQHGNGVEPVNRVDPRKIFTPKRWSAFSPGARNIRAQI